MSNIKAINQQLEKVPSFKEIFTLDFVQERAIENYQAVTGRKDGQNWLHSEALAIISILSQKPDLAKADRFSIWGCLMEAARKGLSIADGHMDLIPYKTKRGDEWTTFLKAEPNYKGMRKQVQDMNEIKFIHEAQVVFMGEEFVHDKLNNKILKHIAGIPPKDVSLANIQAAYVRLEFHDGHVVDVVMYQNALVAARNKSKNTQEGSAWNQFTEEMCKKSVLKRANKIYYKKAVPELPDDEFKVKLQVEDGPQQPPEETDDVSHEEVVDTKVEEVVAEEVKEPVKKQQKAAPPKGAMDDFVN